jgi:hypothetical protein
MKIKAADDIRPDLDALRGLLRRPDLGAKTRSAIELEIRTMEAGAEGERDAAYEIEFYCNKSKNQATIHGLRLEIGDRTAQIDHLIVNRLLDIWVCESKHFAEGVEINEQGEWARISQGRPQGMASPIDQNRRHIAVIEDVIATGRVSLPRRLGLSIRPRVRSLVLISNQARIVRPPGNAPRIEGLESVVKVERAIETINKDFDKRNPAALLKVVTSRELEMFARGLAALHVPARFDWPAKFGLTSASGPRTVVNPTSDRPRCFTCGRGVSDAVIAFCESRPDRFAGKAYCLECQIPIVKGRS